MSNQKKYPKIGLALGSGAAKAMCQLGILKRLMENNIEIGYVMGASAGAVIGGFFALGLNIDEIVEKSMDYVKKNNVSDLSNINFLHESIFKKDYSINFFKEIFGDLTFDDCKIPFAVTAVDLESGKEVVINKGYLWEAIRASTSYPGIFAPVFLDGHYLIDGGTIEDTPVSSLRKKTDCDMIIGSAIFDLKTKQFISGVIYQKFYKKNVRSNLISEQYSRIKTDLKLLSAIISRSINIIREELFEYIVAEAKPDLLIRIYSEDVSFFDFKKTTSLITTGEKAFDERKDELLGLINQKIKELNRPAKNVNLKRNKISKENKLIK